MEEQQYFVLPQHLLYASRQKVWYDITCSRCTAQYYRERGGSAQIMGKNKQPAVARSMLGCLIVSHTSPYYDKWATSPIQCNASKIWMLQHFQKAIDENAPFFLLLLLLLVLSQFTNYIIGKVNAWAAWYLMVSPTLKMHIKNAHRVHSVGTKSKSALCSRYSFPLPTCGPPPASHISQVCSSCLWQIGVLLASHVLLNRGSTTAKVPAASMWTSVSRCHWRHVK